MLRRWGAGLAGLMALWVALVMLAGCDDTKQDVLDGLAFGLDLGALGAQRGVDFAVQRQDFPGCIVAASVRTSCQSGADTLKALQGSTLTALPAIVVDLSRCGEMIEGFEPVAPSAVTGLVADLWTQHGGKIVVRLKALADDNPKLDCYQKSIIGALLEQLDAAVPQIAEELGAPDGVITLPAVPVPACP